MFIEGSLFSYSKIDIEFSRFKLLFYDKDFFYFSCKNFKMFSIDSSWIVIPAINLITCNRKKKII